MFDILTLLKSTRGQGRRLAWRTFCALAWTLWTTQNKLVVEGTIQSHRANYISNGFYLYGVAVSREEEGQ